VKKRKYLFGLLSTILSVGFLFGCNDKKDEAEPDPTLLIRWLNVFILSLVHLWSAVSVYSFLQRWILHS